MAETIAVSQTPKLGKQMLNVARAIDPDHPRSTASRLIGGGVSRDLAPEIGPAPEEVMTRSIVDPIALRLQRGRELVRARAPSAISGAVGQI